MNNTTQEQTKKGRCPHCQADIDLGTNLMVGDRITCGLCNNKCELLWLFPIELGLAPAQKKNDMAGPTKHRPN